MLVETLYTGNVGSVVRAIETTGLTNLWLVNPLVKPDSQAIVLATGASDVIGSVQIVDTLGETLIGCSLVVDISVRFCALLWPILNPRKCGLESVSEATNLPVTLASGHKRVGLTNEELQKYHYHVAIAMSPGYSSLNLAMAAQVISYEVHMARLTTQEGDKAIDYEETEYPLVDDLEHFRGHLKQTLLSTGFIREGHPGQIMNRLRRLFTRAHPEGQELNILRGISASVEQQGKSK